MTISNDDLGDILSMAKPIVNGEATQSKHSHRSTDMGTSKQPVFERHQVKPVHGFELLSNSPKPVGLVDADELTRRTELVKQAVEVLGDAHPLVKPLRCFLTYDNAQTALANNVKPEVSKGLPAIADPLFSLATKDNPRRSVTDVMVESGLSRDSAHYYATHASALQQLLPAIRSTVLAANGESRATMLRGVMAVLEEVITIIEDTYLPAVDEMINDDAAMNTYNQTKLKSERAKQASWASILRVTPEQVTDLETAVSAASTADEVSGLKALVAQLQQQLSASKPSKSTKAKVKAETSPEPTEAA